MVKTAPTTGISAVKDTTAGSAPIKVCMHMMMRSRNEVRAMRAGAALVEAGFDVCMVDVENESTRPAKENINGVHIKHIVIPDWFSSRSFEPWFFLKVLQAFLRSIRWLMQIPADIYHAHELTALPAAYIVARLRHKPLIFEAYELHLPLPETSVFFWRLLGGLFMRFFSVVLPQCAGVITVSSPIAQELRNRYHVPDVTLVRNVPAYRPVMKSDRLRQHLGLSSKTRIALYQGALQANRGLDRLVRAAVFLEPDIVIVMMGEYMGDTQASLEALIASEGVADRVKVIPPVPYKELLDWTASADIGLNVLPPDYSLSIRWCLPNKVFEYLMAGLPVLSSELDAVAEIIRTHDVGQIVASLAPADVGGTINAMLADSSALARMSRNALNIAQEFCWEKEKLQLLRLYNDILAKQHVENEERTQVPDISSTSSI